MNTYIITQKNTSKNQSGPEPVTLASGMNHRTACRTMLYLYNRISGRGCRSWSQATSMKCCPGNVTAYRTEPDGSRSFSDGDSLYRMELIQEWKKEWNMSRRYGIISYPEKEPQKTRTVQVNLSLEDAFLTLDEILENDTESKLRTVSDGFPQTGECLRAVISEGTIYRIVRMEWTIKDLDSFAWYINRCLEESGTMPADKDVIIQTNGWNYPRIFKIINSVGCSTFYYGDHSGDICDDGNRRLTRDPYYDPETCTINEHASVDTNLYRRVEKTVSEHPDARFYEDDKYWYCHFTSYRTVFPKTHFTLDEAISETLAEMEL